MAILPATNISTSVVSAALGVSSKNVSALCLSDRVNEYGFNSPDVKQQMAYWGKTSYDREIANQTVFPNQGYPLGVFRNYDPDWLAFYTEKGIRTPSSNSPFNRIYVQLPIEFCKGEMGYKPYVDVAHTFTVYFNRNNVFNKGTETKMLTSATAYYPYFEFSFLPSAPPDAGATLAAGSTVYFKVVHDNSPARRWKAGIDAVANSTDAECYIFPVTVPADIYTYSKTYRDMTFIAANNGTIYLYSCGINLYGDLRVAAVVPVTVKIGTNSDVTVNTFSVSQDCGINANTTSPGTSVFSGSANFSFRDIQSRFPYGTTLYYQINFNNQGFSGVFSTVVTHDVPLD